MSSPQVLASSTPEATTLRRRMNGLQRKSFTSGGGHHDTNGNGSALGEPDLTSLDDILQDVAGGAIPIDQADVIHAQSPSTDFEEEESCSESEGSSADRTFKVETPTQEDLEKAGNGNGHGSPFSLPTGEEPQHAPRRRASNSSFTRRATAQSENVSGSSSPTRKPAATREWYEINIAVIIALLSPLVNWLTGGNYVQQFVMLGLLVYYLHQIIEMPWTLYHNARPRRKPQSTSINALTPGDRLAIYQAETQLYSLEIFFLALSVISPLLGCILLNLVLGPEVLTWFNTTLFVLSTGVRPWRHLLARMSSRVTGLHDIVHYPTPESNTAQGESEKEQREMKEEVETRKAEIEALGERMEEMSKAVEKLRKRGREDRELLFEYVDDAVEGVDKNVKKWIERADDKFTQSRAHPMHVQVQTPPSLGSLVRDRKSVV